jgi:hypothetical protein
VVRAGEAGEARLPSFAQHILVAEPRDVGMEGDEARHRESKTLRVGVFFHVLELERSGLLL